MRTKRLLSTIAAVVLCFAAMAQTETIGIDAASLKTAGGQPLNAKKANYNASIFAKSGDTLATFNFAADQAGYTLGTYNANNPAPATVSGRVNHAQNGYYATWHRMPNVAFLNSSSFSSNYPRFDQYFMKDYVSAIFTDTMSWGAFDDNGFMLMSCYDQNQINPSNPFNAYFELDEIDASAAAVVDVRFLQFYMKFYDTCYIDYTDATGTWHSMEINVNGIDCDINSWNGRGYKQFTLPLAAAGNQHLKIRFRWYSKARSASQATYGYVWAIDNVTVHAGVASSLQRYAEHYVEGAYGMIPQGMQLPLSWYAPVNNNGAIAQTNVAVNIYSLNSDKTVIGTSATGTHADIAANPGLTDTLYVEGRDNVAANRGWLGYSDSYLNNTYQPSNSGLNTMSDGLHFATATLTTADSNIDGAYDTIPYIVTNDDNGFYAWGYDNGLLLASGTGFRVGYEISNGNLYITDNSDGYNQAGYSVSNRYTTGTVIPTNDDGQKWVIRGIEIVPAATPNSSLYAGAQISANLFVDEYNYDGGLYFRNSDFVASDSVHVNTGAGIHTVTADELNTATGYYFPGNYNTIRIMFPEQPELHPNTSYRIGYTLENNHEFEVATMGTSYATQWDAEGNTSYSRLRDDSALKPYANQFSPNYYDIYITDPTYSSRYGYENSPVPLIRMLVGPKAEIPRYVVTFNQTGDGTISYGNQTLYNGTTHTFAEGSSFTVVITSNTGNCNIYLDGNIVTPYDPVNDTGDPNLIYNNNNNRYEYTFINIHNDHVLNVDFGQCEIRPDNCADFNVCWYMQNAEPYYNNWARIHAGGSVISPLVRDIVDGTVLTVSFNFLDNYYGTNGQPMFVAVNNDTTTFTASFSNRTLQIDLSSYASTDVVMITVGNEHFFEIFASICISSPQAVVTLEADSVAPGTEVMAVANVTAGGAYTLNWNISGTYTVRYNATMDTAYITWSNSGNHCVSVTATGNGWTASSECAFVDVVAPFVYEINALINGQNTTAVDHRITLTASVTQNADEEIWYEWGYSGNGLQLDGQNGNQATFIWFDPGVYTVNVMAQTTLGSATAHHQVTVDPDGSTQPADTVWMPGDTVRIVETEYIHDTTYIYRDTLTLVDTVVDTFYVYLDTLYLYDTIYIHDTIEVGIDSVETDGLKITIGVSVGTITVDGANGHTVQLYDAVGRLLATRRNPNGEVRFEVPATGAYLIKVDGATARRVVVVK